MPANTRALFLVLLMQLCAFTTLGQKLIFGQLGVQQGLPATEVYNLFQDGKGYVWAFTEYGIVRHNGTRFLPVCTNLPFNETAVYKVARSPRGTIYLANANAGLFTVRNDSAIRVTGFGSVSRKILDRNQSVFDMVVDRNDNIWLSAYTCSWKLSQQTGKITPLSATRGNGAIAFMPVGSQYFTRRSFGNAGDPSITLQTENGRRITIPHRLMEEGRYTIRKAGRNYIVMTPQGLWMVTPDGEYRSIPFDKIPLNIEIAPNGHIWVATAYGGLVELSANGRFLNRYFEEETISDILFDDQSGMWVSAIGAGVYYCKNSQNISYEHISALAGNITMLKVVGRRLFIGTNNGELFACDKKGIEPIPLGCTTAINDLIRVGDHYYVALKNALLETDLSFGNIRGLSPIHGGYAFAAGAQHNLLIVSSTRLFDYRNARLKTLSNPRRPRSIVSRNGKDVFVGTREGLRLLRNDVLICPDYLRPLQEINVSKIRKDRRNDIWVCTKGSGLYRLSPANKVTHYGGLPSPVVTDICFLPQQVVAVATNKGVFAAKWNKEGFGPWSLLLDEEIVTLEQYGGQLYIGTKNGLIMRNISDLLHAPDYPFYLRSVVADGQEIDRRNLRLSHRQNNLYFNFDLLAYQLNDKQLFYRLYGPSPGKGKVTGTQLHLQNLLPGKYVLRAYPYNHLTNSRQQALAIVFYIEPAFWQTNLFLGSMIFTTIVLIVGITWTIFYRTRRRAETRSRISRLLAGYRLTALKAQINPHFISNSLSAIQQLILTNQVDRANHYIAQFSLLIRYLLNYSDKPVASLHDEIRIIRLNVELEQLRFSNQFAFETIVADDVPVQELYIPPLITQPFIENAIWHGLLPLTGQRVPTLTLRVAIEQRQLVIAIIDNGVGRPPKQAGNHTGYSDRVSKGTALIQNRIDNLNRLHAANGAVIELKDLEDEHGAPAGTQVNIIFSLEMLNTLYDEQDQEHYY